MRIAAILLLSCATTAAAEPQALVRRAVDALGGAEALARVRSFALALEVRAVGSWRMDDGPARYAVQARTARLRWRRGGGFSHRSGPREGDFGLVSRTWTHRGRPFAEQGLADGARIAWVPDDAAARAVVLAHAAMVLPDRLLADDVVLAPAEEDAVEARLRGGTPITVRFDAETGRPRLVRFRVRDDEAWRETTVELDDWRDHEGIPVAHRRIRRDALGLVAAEARVTAVAWNGPWAPSAPPATLQIDEVAATLGTLPAARVVRVAIPDGVPAREALGELRERLAARRAGPVVVVGDALLEAAVDGGPLPDDLRVVDRPALRVVSVPFDGAVPDARLVRDRITRWCELCGERVAGAWRLEPTESGWRLGAPVEPR